MEISVRLGLRLTAPSVVDAPQMERRKVRAIAGDNVTRENDEPRSPGTRTVKPAEKSWFIVSKFRL